MRQDGAEDGEEAVKRESRGRKEMARDLAVGGGAAGRAAAAGALAALLLAGFHEVDGVLAGGVVGGEVGGAEEVFGIVGEVVVDLALCQQLIRSLGAVGKEDGLGENIPFAFILPSSASFGTTLSTSAASPWKIARRCTNSREKSLVPNVPSRMGATKGSHSLSASARKLTTSRAALLASESHTTPKKRDHTQALSSAAKSSVYSFDGDGGSRKMLGGRRERMRIVSSRVYDGKWTLGVLAV